MEYHFTLYNEETKNNISGIIYLTKPVINSKITNDTPFHYFIGHATGFCKEVYVDLIGQLRKRGINSPITAIDMMNHGNSTQPMPADWTLLAKDVYAVIQHIITPMDPNKVLIGIGHSMGGTVCGLVEVAHPKTFGGLVLLEPVLPPPPYSKAESSFLADMTLKRRTVFPSREAARASFVSKPPFNTWTKLTMDSYVQHIMKDAILDGKKVVTLKLDKQKEAEFYLMGSAHGGYDEIPKIGIPLLIMQGDESTFPAGMYDEILERCKDGHYASVKGGSHFFPMEKPDVVADVALDFIKRHVKIELVSKL